MCCKVGEGARGGCLPSSSTGGCIQLHDTMGNSLLKPRAQNETGDTIIKKSICIFKHCEKTLPPNNVPKTAVFVGNGFHNVRMFFDRLTIDFNGF